MTDDAQIQFSFAHEPQSARAKLIKRWRLLTDVILPGVAKQNRWPISQNHCFMRVCLDKSLGIPWHEVVKRPALRHMTDDQLRETIAVAERILETPSLLFELNNHSIKQRKILRDQS